jgi:glycosyltransferase involved in cell wall biosynthesis
LLSLTVVTPVLDGAPFVAATIESVLAQAYPQLEYIVMDGGSRDGTREVVERYAGRLRYVRQSDAGQADAIARGFELGSGEVLAFLNADDLYEPGAFAAVVAAFERGADVVYGDARFIDASGTEIGHYPVADFDPATFERTCFLSQPATFFRRSAYDRAGGIDRSLHFAFDYDLWIRLARVARFERIDRTLAAARMHPASKTLGQRRASLEESIGVLRRHFGYVPHPWAYALTSNLFDGKDQFFEPTKPSPLKVAASLAMGLYLNPTRPLHHLRDWASYRGFAHRT